MKRILLVNSNTESAPYPVSPLGLCMVASMAEKAGYRVKMFDGLWNAQSSLGNNGNQSLTNTLDDFRPDVIGVSVRNIDDVVMQQSTFYVDEVEQLCIAPIKKYGRGITILGGAGYSLFPEELLQRWQFDYGIAGPGEETFVELLHAINTGRPADAIPGVLIRNKDNTISGNARIKHPGRQSLLHLPYTNIDSYISYAPYLSRSAYPIQTKRGCALKCLYCSYPTLEGTTYQLRTAKEVVDEIESISQRLGGVQFEFVDSTFNHPPGHAENICREIVGRRLNLRLRTMGVNPSGVTPQLIGLMRQAGFAQIDCTPDSASDTMLKKLRKGFSRKKLEEVAQILKSADMPTMWFFVLGGPGETEETLGETFDFIHRFIDERDLVHITEGLRIYPNTGLAEIATKEGLLSKDESLLTPRFYVSAALGPDRLARRVKAFTSEHYNCLRSVDSSPSKEMIREAVALKEQEKRAGEPMFRTLLWLRKRSFKAGQKDFN